MGEAIVANVDEGIGLGLELQADERGRLVEVGRHLPMLLTPATRARVTCSSDSSSGQTTRAGKCSGRRLILLVPKFQDIFPKQLNSHQIRRMLNSDLTSSVLLSMLNM